MENKMTGLDFKIREVAGRIRDLREVNGLSIEEMAQRTGLSVEEYMAHENGSKNLSIAFLYRCVLILGPANNINYDGGWICTACGSGKTYDNGNWRCASEAAIAYMIDARNSVNYTDIFQFMELSYTDCNVQTIKTMVANTFLNNDSYINAIVQAAQQYNVNAYYIVARILQEQGTGGSTLSAGKGYNGQYVGVYNVFNIGASGNGKETVILNGLKNAQSKGWTTMESSIIGGTEIIAQSYIARGQNTLYFQKFDVENSDENLYWHQYMQNILAAQKEGQTLRKTFENVGSVDAGYTFIIPLFKNMPTTASPRPSTTSSQIAPNTELIRVNVTNTLYLRDQPKKSANKIGTVSKDEIITRLEKATEKVDGTYWDYVMKSNGTKGYAARETYDYESTYKLYLVPVNQEATEPEIPEDESIVKNDKVKIDTKNNGVTTVPHATVKDFSDLLGADVIAKNAKGEVLSADAKLSTGCTINDMFTVVVLGDVNGDGEVNSGDLLTIQKDLLNVRKIEIDCNKASADVNQDGKINSADLLKIQKQLLGVSKINL